MVRKPPSGPSKTRKWILYARPDPKIRLKELDLPSEDRYNQIHALLYSKQGSSSMNSLISGRLSALRGLRKQLFSEPDKCGSMDWSRSIGKFEENLEKILQYSLVKQYDSVELVSAMGLIFIANDESDKSRLLGELGRVIKIDKKRIENLAHLLAPIVRKFPAWLDPYRLTRALVLYLGYSREVANDVRKLKDLLTSDGNATFYGGYNNRVGEFAVGLLSLASWRNLPRGRIPSIQEICDRFNLDRKISWKIRMRILLTHFFNKNAPSGAFIQYNIQDPQDASINAPIS